MSRTARILFIAQNQPLDNHAAFEGRLVAALERAERQAHRFSNLDLYDIQRRVHENTRSSLLYLDGRYMDLPDLMNYINAGRRAPAITPGTIRQYYALANTVTLNGIYMYQYLSANGYDPVIVSNYATADLDDLLAEETLAVCISSNFIMMNDMKTMAAAVKEISPNTAVVAGGMLVKKVLHQGERLTPGTLNHVSTFHPEIDAFVVEAKGEQTLVRLLNALRENRGLLDVPNLACFDDQGRVVFTPRREEEMDMDQTAIKWDRVPRSHLRHTLPVNTSQGCYYRCRFCTYHWLFPKVQYRSLEVLREELRSIERLGFARHVRFTDDNFTARPDRVRTVLNMIIKEHFSFSWSSFARASALTPELVKLMKTSGCEFVDLGLESGSQTILDRMDKRLSREQSLKAVQMLNDLGIVSRGSFIIGYPGETEDTFQETIDFINESGLPYYQPYLFYYTGNTLVHQDRESLGLRGLGLAWAHDTMDSVKASLLLSQMMERIWQSYTDGQSYVEEIYKLLRGEGYFQSEIRELFNLKRRLQLATRGKGHEISRALEIQSILSKMERRIRPCGSASSA